MNTQLEAHYLEHNKVWVVRPKGALGTMGWHPFTWSAVFVRAFTEEGAIKRAAPMFAKQRMGLYREVR